MKRRPGFTLIELLVVISIIAILISIILPAMKQARANAKAIQCAAMQRQIGIVLQLYMDDYENQIPPVFDVGIGEVWQHKLRSYMRENRAYEVLHCPIIDLEINGSSTLAYGLNALILKTNLDEPKDLSSLTTPTKTILTADSIIRNGATTFVHPYDSRTSGMMPVNGFAAFVNTVGQADYRHLDAANILYLDMHIVRGEVPLDDSSGAGNQIFWKGL